MKTCIGIRREDKNEWEQRAPLTPHDVSSLIKNEGLSFVIQPSPIRVFKENEYKDSGAEISEDLSKCGLVFAIKEIPIDFVMSGKTYVFFSHTIKGQEHNMPLLKKIMEAGSTLIDYERVVDENNKRLIFFGEYAGLAGMIDTLWAFGKRLDWEKVKNPFGQIKQAYQYHNLDEAAEAISNAAEEIGAKGLDPSIVPLIIGIAGYGNVSRGAQKILDFLPTVEIEPKDVADILKKSKDAEKKIYKVVFHEEHTVEPITKESKFELQDYIKHPEKYRPQFSKYLLYLSILVNCIYWDKKYPRLVTKNEIKELYSKTKKLKVVGDISCDIEGGIEFTTHVTDPHNPVFVWDVTQEKPIDGVAGNGPVVLAIDNLPCELPRESSNEFSHVLKRFIPAIAKADFNSNFEKLNLPPEIKKAVIVYKGRLTPDYEYLIRYLDKI